MSSQILQSNNYNNISLSLLTGQGLFAQKFYKFTSQHCMMITYLKH